MNKQLIFIIVSTLVVALYSKLSLAFPETARHGYLSCATCHYSPSGRGQLTPYGKTLSHELYSFWKSENESESLESATPWWQVGGQARLLQFVEDTKTVQKARFFPMQAEISGAIDLETWAIVGSIGAWRPLDSTDKTLRAYSRDHYFLFRPTENYVLRAGHFRISHGLGLPDHTALVYAGLGWTHSHETYNVEASYLDDNNVWQATAVLPSKLLVTEEDITGASVNIQRLIYSKNKIGLNVAKFERNKVQESQLNIHGVVEISEESFIQAELANRVVDYSTKLTQQAFFSRYSYQLPWWGIRPLAQYETALLDKTNNLKAQRAYIGAEFFPITNFDLLVLAGQENQTGLEKTNVFNAVGHFYF